MYDTFIAASGDQFIERFARSRIFDAFLESRLNQMINQQNSLDTLQMGSLYPLQQSQLSMSSTIIGSNSVVANFSLTTVFKQQSFEKNNSSEPDTEDPLTYQSESEPEAKVNIQFE